MAVRETILFLTQRFPKLSREEAYMIAIVAIASHVTQVVDGTKGIHGMIPSQLRRAVSALTLSGSILGKVPSRRFMQTPRWRWATRLHEST